MTNTNIKSLGADMSQIPSHGAAVDFKPDERNLVCSASDTASTSAPWRSLADFEAIKQAFQPTVASEEDGRRSWSAFDMWQSDMMGARQRMQWAEGIGSASADSLPHLTTSSGFLPLDRSSSAGTGNEKADVSLPDAEHMRNLSKVKRAFRWPFRPNHVQEDVV
jgi:hypothetical protein